MVGVQEMKKSFPWSVGKEKDRHFPEDLETCKLAMGVSCSCSQDGTGPCSWGGVGGLGQSEPCSWGGVGGLEQCNSPHRGAG